MKAKDRVSRFNKTTVELSNGDSFIIVNQMNDNDFDIALNSWLVRTDDYTPESFVWYVKDKLPNIPFLTLEDYEAITKGKGESATEADYLAENQ